MIDRVLAILGRIALPHPIKEDLIAAIRQIPDRASVSGQNNALYRACGAIKATTLPLDLLTRYAAICATS